MIKWNFPSRNNGDIEGFSNPALEWFKGNPLRAMAREICQNSLDAQYDEDKPVTIEFFKTYENASSFPGMQELQSMKTIRSWIITSRLRMIKQQNGMK